MKNEIKPGEAKSLVDRLGPSIGGGLCDFTHAPSYPETRRDVCAVTRTAEDGHSYGFDTVYLLWRKSDGDIDAKEIANSRDTKKYLHAEGVIEDGEEIVVNYGGKEYREKKEILGLD